VVQVVVLQAIKVQRLMVKELLIKVIVAEAEAEEQITLLLEAAAVQVRLVVMPWLRLVVMVVQVVQVLQ
jgi:hypothetical protein